MATMDAVLLGQLTDIANRIRIHSIVCTTAANSGHPTSSCSMADIMAVLFFDAMKYYVEEPRHALNDRFVLSKGHACPALYGAWVEAGLIPEAELLNVRKIDNDLEGHPTPRLNFIDVATGSLGMGLSFAAGMAYTGKYFDDNAYRTFCLMGDGEVAEGSVWEAFHFASHYKLDNLVAIIDCNRLGQSEPTSLGHDLKAYENRVTAFGWNCICVDGHSIPALSAAFASAAVTRGRPTCIVAKTFKGRGIPGIEDELNWHGKPLPADMAEKVIAGIRALSKERKTTLKPKVPPANCDLAEKRVHYDGSSPLKLCADPDYDLGDSIATRAAYGTGLLKLGKVNPRVIALDGDVKNSSMSITFQKQHPERFVECFIAEQNMVGIGIGAACRDRTCVFISTFAAFLCRAFDQVRMAAISFSNMNLVGSHAGCSIGADGPSQMALEDLALFRTIPSCTIFYPSDAISTEYAIELAANTKGICFIRTTRANTPVVYDKKKDVFKIGVSKMIRQGADDQCLIIGAAVTLLEAVKAHTILKAQHGIATAVLDPFTIKPLDVAGITAAARAAGDKVVVVEDHYEQGGIGEAVAAAIPRDISVRRLFVPCLPRSGKPDELLHMFGIDSDAIVKAVVEEVAN